jgi:hypothetical protein
MTSLARAQLSPPRLARACRLLLAGLALGLAACAEQPAAQPQEPPGALLVARTADLERLLDQLDWLEGTPLARRIEAIRAALPVCPIVESHAPDGSFEQLLSRLECRPDESELEHLHRERGDDALAFAWPLGPGLRLRGWIVLDERGGVELDLRLPRQAVRGPRALLLPGEETPGPGVLSGSQRLFHARARPQGGLDFASLVPEGGQADRMFRLKSELFAGAVLDGTWEAAIYLPTEGDLTPPAALALGFSRRALAVAAVERFIDDLRSIWPVQRSFFALGDAEGACLLDLRILPDLAPCYVATDRAVVVGWNPASLRKALDGVQAAAPLAGPGSGGGLLLELASFAEADARLARAAGDQPAQHVAASPWQRLHAQARHDGDRVLVRVHLEPRGDT